jgi:hypothetical protein
MEKEIYGYRLNGVVDRFTVDAILRNAMPKWVDNDPSVYFIRGHIAGSLVARMRELKVLDLWFEPIYEPFGTWITEHHENYYIETGIFGS